AKPTAGPSAAPIRIATNAPGRLLASHPTAASAAPAPMPAATPMRYHSHMRSSLVLESGSKTDRPALAKSPARDRSPSGARRRLWAAGLHSALDSSDHREAELGCARAVDDA